MALCARGPRSYLHAFGWSCGYPFVLGLLFRGSISRDRRRRGRSVGERVLAIEPLIQDLPLLLRSQLFLQASLHYFETTRRVSFGFPAPYTLLFCCFQTASPFMPLFSDMQKRVCSVRSKDL